MWEDTEDMEDVLYSEVLEFIDDNRTTFSILEKDLETIAMENERITLQKKGRNRERGRKTAVKKPLFAQEYEKDASITKELVTFNGQERLKNMNEVFFDFLLNHFNTVKGGQSFTLSYGNIFDDVGHLRLYDKQDQLVYLSTLFCMMFNQKFLKSVDLESFQRFLFDNKLLLLGIPKGEMRYPQEIRIKMTQKGKTSQTRYLDEMYKYKKNNFINAVQLLSDLSREKKYQATGHGRSHPIREKAYKYLTEENNVFENVFPKNLQKSLDFLLERATGIKLPSNITNDFTIEAIFSGMDKNLSRTFYRGFRKNIIDGVENKDLDDSYKKFIVTYLLIRKYGYKKISKSNYINSLDLDKIFKVKFLDTHQHHRILDLDRDFLVEYIKKQFTSLVMDTSSVLPILFSFVILTKVKAKNLDYIMEHTTDDFRNFLRNQLRLGDGEDFKEVIELYNIKGIQTKDLFVKMKSVLNAFYYKRKSNEYKTFDVSVRKEIAKNFIKNVVLMETSYVFYTSNNPEEEAKTNNMFNKIMKEVSDLMSVEF